MAPTLFAEKHTRDEQEQVCPSVSLNRGVISVHRQHTKSLAYLANLQPEPPDLVGTWLKPKNPSYQTNGIDKRMSCHCSPMYRKAREYRDVPKRNGRLPNR